MHLSLETAINIFELNAGKLYVISGDTKDIFKVGEDVFLNLNKEDIKVLND